MRAAQRWLALAAVVVALFLSTSKYLLEAFPKKVWRSDALLPSNEICPDGMDVQIELFGAVWRGEPQASEHLHAFLASTYQSSTYLVGLLGGPLHALGIPAAIAFACISAAATLVLLRLLWALLGSLLADRPGLRLLAFLVFAFHPTTIRCFMRPQTDALYGLAVLLAIAWGWRLGQPETSGHRFGRGTWAALALTQSAGLFVKIHAVVLPFVPAFVGFLQGLRGRRLFRAICLGGLLPLLVWAALFQYFGLWETISNIWKLKVRFFENWNAWRVLRILLLTQVGLLAAAFLHPRLFRGFPLALLLFLVGYGALLYLTITPPSMRYAYPAQAPLVLLAATALHERFRSGRWATAWLAAVLACQLTLLALYFGVQLYLRYVGPPKDIAGLAAFVFDLL